MEEVKDGLLAPLRELAVCAERRSGACRPANEEGADAGQKSVVSMRRAGRFRTGRRGFWPGRPEKPRRWESEAVVLVSKIHGFPFDLVRSAVYARILSGEDVLGGFPAFGKYEERGGRWFYLMEVADGEPRLEFEMDLGGDMRDAVRNGFPHREFVLIRKDAGECTLLTAFGVSEEQAEEALSERLVREYLKFHGIDGKKETGALVDWFMRHMEGAFSSGKPGHFVLPISRLNGKPKNRERGRFLR